MEQSRFIRGLLDDPRDPQLPQYEPQNDFAPRAYGLLNELFPDPNVMVGDAVRQYRGGDPIGAFETMFSATPATGMARVAAPQHGISKLRLDRPVSEMTRDVVSKGEIKPRVTVDPAELQGSTLIAGVGDRTDANGILRAINGQELAGRGVDLQGGPDFMRTHPTVWASGKGKITTLQRKASEVENPVLFYTAMGNRAGDFSHHTAEGILGMLPNAKITRQGAKELNGILADEIPNFPGLLSPDLPAFLASNAGARSALAKRLDMADAQKLGAPNIGHIRYGITNPDLIDAPLNSGGYSMARLDPKASVIADPSVPHSTYPAQLAGQYIGGLEQMIPPELAFRDFVAQQRPETLSNAAKLGYNIEKSIPTQKVDQQWVDTVSAYLERARNGF